MELCEEMYQGYCRTCDRSRIVTCEYHREGEKKVLDFVDCAYGKCVHSRTCKLMEPVREEYEMTELQ